MRVSISHKDEWKTTLSSQEWMGGNLLHMHVYKEGAHNLLGSHWRGCEMKYTLLILLLDLKLIFYLSFCEDNYDRLRGSHRPWETCIGPWYGPLVNVLYMENLFCYNYNAIQSFFNIMLSVTFFRLFHIKCLSDQLIIQLDRFGTSFQITILCPKIS